MAQHVTEYKKKAFVPFTEYIGLAVRYIQNAKCTILKKDGYADQRPWLVPGYTVEAFEAGID